MIGVLNVDANTAHIRLVRGRLGGHLHHNGVAHFVSDGDGFLFIDRLGEKVDPYLQPRFQRLVDIGNKLFVNNDIPCSISPEAQTDNGKINAVCFYPFPVDVSLKIRYVYPCPGLPFIGFV